MSILEIITLAGTAQGVFLAIILFARRFGNIPSHRFLAWFILFASLSIGGFVLYDNRFLVAHPHFILTYNAFDLALGPLFYFHIRALTEKDFKWQWNSLFHFSPVLVVFIYHIPFYLMTAPEKMAWIQESYVHTAPDYLLLSLLSTVQMCVYLLLCYSILKRHAVVVKNYFSDAEKRNLHYIRIFLLIVLVMFLLCLSISIVGYDIINKVSNLVITFTIYWLGYRNLNQREIFTEIKEWIEKTNVAAETENIETRKYQKSEISTARANRIISELNELMEKERMFTDNELNLQMLSNRLGISNHNLSQILNQNLGENFYDFVNRYRVEEVKRQIHNPEKSHLSLLGLAMDCGFNSKAAFNTAFKKNTGKTPSEYRKFISP